MGATRGLCSGLRTQDSRHWSLLIAEFWDIKTVTGAIYGLRSCWPQGLALILLACQSHLIPRADSHMGSLDWAWSPPAN